MTVSDQEIMIYRVLFKVTQTMGLIQVRVASLDDTLEALKSTGGSGEVVKV